ncbi:MAG: hypothetical protein WCG22_08210 [Lentisphaerota bacterium]
MLYLRQMDALRALPAQLDPAQIEALRDLLALPFDGAYGLGPLAFNGIKNGAADLLLRQEHFPPDLAYDFAAMFDDSAYDEVWRDYCLQMLVDCYQKLAHRDVADAPAARAVALDTLREAARVRIHTWPGTALLGLDAIARSKTGDVTDTEVDEIASALALDPGASEAGRITALRIAGERRLSGVSGTARDLAQTARTETLRAAAIATLGDLGAASDLELLQSLSAERDPFLAQIAHAASRKLAERHPEAGGAL